MKDKEYKLKTIKEILEVVNEKNIDCFLKDFSDLLRFTLEIKRMAKLAENDNIKVSRKYSDEFLWIDDGKNDAKINIEITNTNIN